MSKYAIRLPGGHRLEPRWGTYVEAKRALVELTQALSGEFLEFQILEINHEAKDQIDIRAARGNPPDQGIPGE